MPLFQFHVNDVGEFFVDMTLWVGGVSGQKN